MTGIPCARESQMLEALQTSAWPEACDPDLRAHAAECASCRELISVVIPLLDEHHAAVAAAPVPSSGVVWWRAQMRARQEAARAAARPIWVAQAIGVACAIGLIAGGLTVFGPSLPDLANASDAGDWFAWAFSQAGLLEMPAFDRTALQSLAPTTMVVLLALSAVLLLAPLALYLSARD